MMDHQGRAGQLVVVVGRLTQDKLNTLRSILLHKDGHLMVIGHDQRLARG